MTTHDLDRLVVPVLNGAVSLTRFRVLKTPTRGKDWPRAFVQRLRRQRFEPLDPEGTEEERSAGWVELHDADSSRLAPGQVFFGDDLLVSWRIDQVRVPPSVLRKALSDWQYAFESERGRKPTKKEKAEEKEQTLRRLRRKAFVTTQTHDLRWRMDVDELQFWTTSHRVIDEMVVAVEESLGLVLRPMGPGGRWNSELHGETAPTPELFGGAGVADE